MEEHCLIINGIPTRILTWGKGINAPFEDDDNLIIFITGNPGVTRFYTKYLQELHNACRHPIWIIGHAGHERIDSHHMPPRTKENEHLFSLFGQIDHKVRFIEDYVPKNVKLHLIGHSIGAYIILNLLKYPAIKSQVDKNYLLFPTIEHMAESSNGTIVMKFLRHFHFLLHPFTWLFWILPDFIKAILVTIYCKMSSIPLEHRDVIKDLIDHYTLGNVSQMGMDEMHNVKEKDKDVLIENIDKIKLYYGRTDGWVPLHYYHKVIEDIPEINAELCSRGIDHAFVLRHSIPMAQLTSTWINDFASNTTNTG